MRPQDLLYSALNPIVAGLLRSPFHGVASGSLCVLAYRGRRSGKRYATPLSYVREGSRILLLSSHNTRWWKNFVDEPRAVEVEIARETHRGRAKATVDDGEAFRDGVRRFLRALPRDARVYGIGLERGRTPREADIETAAGHVVLVEVEFDD
jgi:hypothetical protein